MHLDLEVDPATGKNRRDPTFLQPKEEVLFRKEEKETDVLRLNQGRSSTSHNMGPCHNCGQNSHVMRHTHFEEAPIFYNSPPSSLKSCGLLSQLLPTTQSLSILFTYTTRSRACQAQLTLPSAWLAAVTVTLRSPQPETPTRNPDKKGGSAPTRS